MVAWLFCMSFTPHQRLRMTNFILNLKWIENYFSRMYYCVYIFIDSGIKNRNFLWVLSVLCKKMKLLAGFFHPSVLSSIRLSKELSEEFFNTDWNFDFVLSLKCFIWFQDLNKGRVLGNHTFRPVSSFWLGQNAVATFF